MAKLLFIPSPEIEGQFKVVNTIQAKIINTKIGDVDLSTISLEDAKRLHELGTDYLVPEKKANTLKK